LQSEKLGDRVNYYTDIPGLLPLKQQYSEFFQDFVLNGKLVFYQNGFIFVDNRIYAIVLSYDDIAELNFYLADDVWLEVKAK